MRLHLTLATLTVLLLILTLHSGGKHRFTFAQVEKIAAQRAQQKYAPLPNVLPPQLKNLNPQQEAQINWKDDYRLWRSKGLPFQVEFLPHRQGFPLRPAHQHRRSQGRASARLFPVLLQLRQPQY